MHLCSSGILACNLSFLVYLSGFGIRVMLTSWNVLGRITPFLFKKIGKDWYYQWFNSSLNAWYKPTVKPSGPGLSFVGRFLTIDSVSLLVNYLFRFSISSWLSLGKLYVSKNLLFLISFFSNLFTYNCSNLLWIFLFLWYQL